MDCQNTQKSEIFTLCNNRNKRHLGCIDIISMDDIEDLVNGTSETGSIDLNVKDVVKVHVEEVAMSAGNRMLWTLLRVDKGQFEFSLAGTVR